MKAVVYTLGCKLNQYESFSIMNNLLQQGYDVTEHLEPADLYVINTCAVTAEAERKSRQVIAKIKKLNSSAKIIICGCASEKNPESFLSKDSSVTVTGSYKKSKISDLFQKEGIYKSDQPKEYEDDLTPLKPRTRAYIKVQDGCDNFCSYCIVPYLRGRSRSRNKESILKEILSLSNDCKEFILTGINLSDYGKGIQSSLKELIFSLSQVDSRIRLGSLEIRVIEENLLTALKSLKNFCPHFHLSLQSGSDSVLKHMNRHYNSKEFKNAVFLIRQYFPDAAVTTDVICGFPSETEENFEESTCLCEEIGFADMHIFPYSRREGTAAFSLSPLPKSVVFSRVNRLTALRDRLKKEYIATFEGKTLQMLAEEQQNGYTIGYSENYIRCYLAGEYPINEIISVKVVGEFQDGAKVHII